MRFFLFLVLSVSGFVQAKEVKTSMPFYLSVGGIVCDAQDCSHYNLVRKTVTVDLEPLEHDTDTYYGRLSVEHDVLGKKYISRVAVFLNKDQSMDFILSTHEDGVYDNPAATSVNLDAGKSLNFSGHFHDFAADDQNSLTTTIFIAESLSSLEKGMSRAFKARAYRGRL